MELTFSAKTVDLAVAAAAENLGIEADKVRYEVIEEGKKGLFSSKDAVIRVISGGKAARVKAFLEDIVKNFPLEGVEVEVTEEDQVLSINGLGEEASYLIGRRGDT